MVNNCIFTGRWTDSPVLKITPNGKSVTNATLAVNRAGTKDTDFVPVIMWESIAKNVCKYTHKGSLVAVEGRFNSRRYEDKEGKKRNVYEILATNVTFLGSKDGSSNEYISEDMGSDEEFLTTDNLPF